MKTNFFSLIILIAIFAGCSPATKVTKSWTDPSLTPDEAEKFKKVLVVAPLNDESSKRIAEDKLVSVITQMKAVQSYSYLNTSDTSQTRLEERMKTDGFDCILLVRLANVEKNLSYTPGTSYGGWYGYRNYSEGYYTEDQTFYVETNFYSFPENKLLWSCVTSTLNPTKLDNTMDQIIYAIKNELNEKGLIK
jgi:hypothetical protein